MKRKRKESCPSPILDDSPKRTKVQAQRKFAQNSGLHSPIMSPIRDLETADFLPHTSVLREPVELLPMKRPNTEDFLTFLCFRGTPILPSNLQFFNTASIVSDGQVHEIKGDSAKNGPIDISKCAGSSSDKPFIAFGVRKRADPIVISRQMERKRRHALAIQALRRKYQEQKMAKIRALTISKLSEKTTNKTLVKTNTIQKTETVTKKTNTLQKTNTLHKTNTLQKTKVIATKHVKVTTQTLKTKVKPKMCLRSFRGKFVQKELPFRARRALQERENAKQRADIVKRSVIRTSKNSNKPLGEKVQKISKAPPPLKPLQVKQKVKKSSNARVTRSGSVTTVVRKPTASVALQRAQVKRRILLPSTTVSVLRPKLRSTTTKKTVISRKKAQQRVTISVHKTKGDRVVKGVETDEAPIKDGSSSRASPSEAAAKKSEKESSKRAQDKDATRTVVSDNGKKVSPQDKPKRQREVLKRVTRRDSELAIKNVPEKATDKNAVKKEVTKNLELKKEVKIAETSAKKEVKKSINLKRAFRLKSNAKDIKKDVDIKKSSNTVLENTDEGQKVKRDFKTVEMTVKKVVTRKSDETKRRETCQPEEKSRETYKKDSNMPARPSTSGDKEPVPKETIKKSPRATHKASNVEKDVTPEQQSTENVKKVTRGSVTQKKNVAVDELGETSSAANTLEVSLPKLEPIVRLKELKNVTENKTQNKELTAKNLSKEEFTTKPSAKTECGEEDDLKEKPLENTLKEELGVRKTSRECGMKGSLKTASTAKKTSEEGSFVNKLIKDPPVKKNPQKVADEEAILKKTSKESAAKRTQKADLVVQKVLEKEALLDAKPQEITAKSLPKEDLPLKKPIDEDLTLKNAPVAIPAPTLNDFSICVLPEIESESKKTTNEFPIKLTEPPILNKSSGKLLVSNVSSKSSISKPNPKEELITRKEPELEIALKKVTSESILKAIPENKPAKQEEEMKSKNAVNEPKPKSIDDLITTQKPSDGNLSAIVATKEQTTKCTVAEKLVEQKKHLVEELTSDKSLAEYVAKRLPKEEIVAMLSSEDEIGPKKWPKESTRKNTPKDHNTVKKVSKDEGAAKKGLKQELSPKKTPKEEVAKRKPTPKREEPEQAVQKASPRPSRKTKEAAAIYMEILSHKLVNDSTIDDDNVSIDSFPELPNVKKTEQREIELKAQAKTSKEEEGKGQHVIEKVDDKKGKKVGKGKKDALETAKAVLPESSSTPKENVSHAKCSEIDINKAAQSNPNEGPMKKSLERLKSPSSDKASSMKALEKAKNKGKNLEKDNIDNIKAANDDTSSFTEKPTALKSLCGKRKSNPATIASDSDSDNEVLQAKIRKCEAQKVMLQDTSDRKETIVSKKLVQKQDNPPKTPAEEETPTRRQTRRSTHVAKESASDSSDESFHIDVRVPRKKKVTRSQNRGSTTSFSVLEKNVDIILEAARVLEGEKVLELEESGKKIKIEEKSDDKTKIEEEGEDDKPLKSILNEEKATKNLSEDVKMSDKPKLAKKTDSLPLKDNKKGASQDILSDSDESTTSDINLKSLQVRQRNKKLSKTKSAKSSVKSAASFSDSDEEPLAKLTTKNAAVVESEIPKKKPAKTKTTTIRKTADKSLAELPVMEPKAKRECTKRPSNYLPMLSSSDEDDEPLFHGFSTSKEDSNRQKTFVQALAPSLDLLSKDIGRKGKVNMSNEQIEQWLKDSALAGSSVAKENDAMLKFGEKIPVEGALEEIAETQDEQDLKLGEVLKANDEAQTPSSKTMILSEEKPKIDIKSPLADRKWIFKKDKVDLAPNKNAFSPENELSVYAFGEENEDVISTPFRRPSRRPSSTATSRSEDDLSKNDENSKQSQFRKPGLLPSDSEDSRCFNIPQNPTKLPKAAKLESMVPPSTSYHSKRPAKSTFDRFPEPFDDFKYKIPSSPSASSGSSAKLYKKGTPKQKGKAWEVISPVYVSDFPKPTDLPKLVEAPVFHPTDQEFQDPLEYIERIRHKAEQFGICKIVPPSSFKPECKVSDDMRFTAYNQYVHKMLHRWGPNFKEFMVIKKYLATQNIPLKTPPLIGGMEIDLPRLYQTVQSLGGLKEVIEKKKWSKVSDHMKIPKLAQDRVTKLDDIYCKYLLPYDTLSPAEREKLFDEVETYWAKRESKNLQLKSEAKNEAKPEESSEQDEYESDDNEAEECTVKSKNMALNAFYRIARNTMSMYFKVAEPTAQEVEQEFWRYVTQKQNHICVHSASIDCGSWGYGFAVSKNSPFARHAWNLKVMSNNSGSVLRSLGPVMGVTIPTLHVGMVFSACCWYRDPHGLPWVEYLHTGGSKIWYGIPSSSCEVFQAAMRKLVPNYCRDKDLWLPSDTAMVPPGLLMEHNVSLCRTVQEPGQFLVVFPKVFTSSVSTGYVVSESVYFAPLYWLRTARNLFNDLKNSCEPSMFSLDKLLISISNDSRSSVEALRVIIPYIEELYTNERDNRVRLRNFGKIEEEKMTGSEVTSKKKRMQSVEDVECEICRTNLFVSMVVDTQDDLIYCLEHAIDLVVKNGKMVDRFKLKYVLDETELKSMPAKISFMIDAKLQKKVPSKYAGLPTLLK